MVRASYDDVDTPAERIRRYKDILTKEYGISLPSNDSYDSVQQTGTSYTEELEVPALSTSYGVTEDLESSYDAGPPAAPAFEPTARVKFRIAVHINYGSTIRVIGGHPLLGSWITDKALEMEWSPGDVWTAEADLPVGGIYEYKYVLVNSKGHPYQWQQGNNAVLAITPKDQGTLVEVHDFWHGSPEATVLAGGLSSTRETRLLTWAAEVSDTIQHQRSELRRSRMELWQVREEVREARQEAATLRTELALETRARLGAERRMTELELENRRLRAQIRDSQESFRGAMGEARRLLTEALGGRKQQQQQHQHQEAEEEGGVYRDELDLQERVQQSSWRQ